MEWNFGIIGIGYLHQQADNRYLTKVSQRVSLFNSVGKEQGMVAWYLDKTWPNT